MMPFTEIAQAMEVIFHLKEDPKPSNFITEADLKRFGLALARGPQVAFATSPTTTISPSTSYTSLKVIVDPANGFSVVQSCFIVSLSYFMVSIFFLARLLAFCLLFLYVNLTTFLIQWILVRLLSLKEPALPSSSKGC